jgi:hypothetical protein
MNVNATSVAGSIAGATTVCSGTNSSTLTLSGNTGTVQWQTSSNDTTFTNISGATSATYAVSNISATTYYRAVVTSGACASATTSSVTMNVNATSVAGSIAGATTVCSGTNSTTLTLSGNTGTVQWQTSSNDTTFTNISGATSLTYAVSNISATTYYRAVVTSGACASATTSSVTMNVNATSVAGSIAGATTVTSGTNSTTLTLSGNTGTIQWQTSANNVTFTAISGANAVTYVANNLTTTTYYRAVVTNGACAESISNVATITVIQIVGGSLAGGAAVCNSLNSNTLTLSGNVGTISGWQNSTTNDFSSNVINITNTTTSLTATNINVTTYYRAVITGNGLTVYSSVATLFFTATSLVLEPISGPINICGMTSATYTVPALTTGTTNYVWTLPAGLSVFSSVGNQLIINVDSLFDSGFITAKAVNNCGESNTVNIFVSKPPFLTTITGPTTTCGITTATYSTTAIAGATYTWQIPALMTVISGQGTASVTVSISNGFASGVVRVSSTSPCGVSNLRRLPVYSAQIPSTINGPNEICNIGTATYSTPNIFAPPYTWTVTNDMTIVSGQGSSSIVVAFTGSFVSGTIGVSANGACGSSDERILLITNARTPRAIVGPKVLCGSSNNTYDEAGNLLNSIFGQAVYSVPLISGATIYNWNVPTGASITAGQGTNSIIVNFDLTTFVNGNITVATSNACGLSPTAVISVVRVTGEITGPSQICGLTSSTYSVPLTIGTGFTWVVPSWMSITSGQGTNSITVNITNSNSFSADLLNVNYTSNCATSESISLNVGCADYTQLIPSQCNATLPFIYTAIQAQSPLGSLASMYKFRINDGTTDYFVESLNGKFRMTNVPGLIWQFGTSYSVSVALKVSGVYKDYGVVCTVTMPALPITQIQSAQCNTTLASQFDFINANWIDGATTYRFRISDGVTTQILIRPTFRFRLSNFVWAMNKTYTIDVAIQRGAGSFGPYGPACTITTPSNNSRFIETELNAIWEVNFDQNPFENYFKLNLVSTDKESVMVSLYDLTGKQVQNITTTADNLSNYQFGSNIEAGIYFVSIKQGSHSQTLKMIKR